MKKAIFLDKDGTLIRDVPYNCDPELIQLQEHMIKGLQKLQKAGFLLIIISNQSGVARGYFSESALKGVENHLGRLFQIQNLCLDGFYYCPHHPDGYLPAYRKNCECRKPAPGMLFRAAKDLDINLFQSWMMGDILDDVEAGNRAGCRTLLINNGHETLWELTDKRVPDLMAPTINRAADMLLMIDKVLTSEKRTVPLRPVLSSFLK